MRDEQKRIRGGRGRAGARRRERSGCVRILSVGAFGVVLSLAVIASAEAPEREAAPDAARSAASAFDARFAPPTRVGGEAGVGVAGRVVERFTPPVAAPIDGGLNPVPVTALRASVLRPCDTPGSGCQNVQAVSTQVGVPPIVPGTRPPASPSP